MPRMVFPLACEPDSTASSACCDSVTPPAQDSTAAFMSFMYELRSAACCACEGLCDSATSTAAPASSTIASSAHIGVRRTGQPLCLIGTYGGGSAVVGMLNWSAPHGERDALAQVGERHRAEDAIDDLVLGIEEERLRQRDDAVGVRCAEMRIKPHRIGHAVRAGE